MLYFEVDPEWMAKIGRRGEHNVFPVKSVEPGIRHPFFKNFYNLKTPWGIWLVAEGRGKIVAGSEEK